MKTFLCSQIMIEEKQESFIKIKFVFNEILRIVKAQDKEEAINKFLSETKYIIAAEKLDVVCTLLSDLIEIK